MPYYILAATVLGKRSHDFDVPPWLKELHSKIWNRGDLKSQLFRKVEVTGAHYTTLRERLNERYPDRDSPGYEGGEHDVQDIKLDLLNSIVPAETLSSLHPDDNENGVDDTGFDVESLFPSVLHYLDLSSLKIKNEQWRLPSPLYLRQEYDDISELSQGRRNLVIVSGQPGTGEVIVTLSLSHRI